MIEILKNILQSTGFWETLSGSFIGTFTALIIFVMESRREKKNIKAQKKESYYNALVYFKLLLDNIISHKKKQTVAYEDHSTAIFNTPLSPVLLKLYKTNDVDRLLNKFDQERLFQAYLEAFGNNIEVIKEFKDIYSSLDFLDFLTKQAETSQEMHSTQLYEDLVLYKSISEDEVLKKCILLLEKIKGYDVNFKQNAIYSSINNLIIKYYETSPDPLTIEHMQLNLIKPLTALIINNFRNDPEIFLIVSDCRRATWLYNDIIFKSNDIAREFHEYHIDGTSIVKKLENYKNIANFNPVASLVPHAPNP